MHKPRKESERPEMTEEIIALIPARSGSKTVVHKNIRPMAGRPMLAWSIQHALDCPDISRVIVSTDSEEYAGIARRFGADVPFLRPAELSGDFATDLDVFAHALDWLEQHEGRLPGIFVHLRPTCPIRRVSDLSAMIALLKANPEADSVRSVVEAPKTPYKMWNMEAGRLVPVASCPVPEAYNAPRQQLPVSYIQNAAIDVLRARTVREKGSMTGDTILGYVMDAFVDIDTEADFRRAEALLLAKQPAGAEPRTFCIDIDGVIAALRVDLDYGKAHAIPGAVRSIQRLHTAGHRIVLFTARGSVTGIDWRETTEAQLQRWGVPYHELRFGKPAADYYIDDRMLDLELFWSLSNGS